MMNPGQKRSYPFSDDENLADQQVTFNFLTKHMQMHENLHIFMQKIHIKCIFWKFYRIKRNFRPQKLSKGRLNLKKRKLNLLKTQLLNQTGKSG